MIMRMRTRGLLAVLAAAFLGTAGTAFAGQTTVSGGGFADVTVQASPGDVNTITVTATGRQRITVTDSGGTITDGNNLDGCTVTGEIATCLTGANLMVFADDGNDTVTLAGDFSSLVPVGIGILGGAGDDVLNGSNSADTLAGDDGNDTLNGNDGNDVLDGGAGNDVGDGGDGNDQGLGGAGDDTFDGGSGADVFLGDDFSSTDPAEYGNDTFHGGEGDDYAVLPGRLDPATGRSVTDGNDSYDGGPGTDLADYSNRTDDLHLSNDGAANDGQAGESDNLSSVETLEGGQGDDTLSGGGQRDVLTGNGGDDTLTGNGGSDTLIGDDGNDTLNGGDGADQLAGRRGNDTINGDAGSDELAGEDGDDALKGGAGDDGLYGGQGRDALSGDDGDDYLDAGEQGGPDSFAGGSGNDTIGYTSRSAPLKIALDGSTDNGEPGENDTVGADIENAIGGSGDDTITGNAGNNALRGDDWSGGTGNDTLSGGDGNDDLDGGDGNDNLAGGNGNDVARPGSGNDTFAGDAGDDRMFDSSGNDAFAGGAGVDTASYDSGQSVNVSLDGQANDGQTGEADNMGTDVENVVGSSSADVITGNAAANMVQGRGGGDVINLAGDKSADKVICSNGVETANVDALDRIDESGGTCEVVNTAGSIGPKVSLGSFSRHLGKRGTALRLVITCPVTATEGCVVTGSLKPRSGKGKLLGKGRLTLPTGGRGTMRVKLTKTALKSVRAKKNRKRGIRGKLVVSAADARNLATPATAWSRSITVTR